MDKLFITTFKKMSIQLGNPILLAKLTKKEIASDFRKYDIKNNGQGAPLAPIYHQYLVKQMKAIVNCISKYWWGK